MHKLKIVVGLTGLSCVGKSTISSVFEKHGAIVYEVDKAVHKLYGEPDVVSEIEAAFGSSVIKEGAVDRKQVASIVFADPKKMDELTTIVYGRIKSQVLALIDAFLKTPNEILILDAPTLFQVGFDKYCDKIVVASADQMHRQIRAAKRGWSALELIRSDALLSRKVLREHDFILNNGTIKDLECRVIQIIGSWRSQAEENSKLWQLCRTNDFGDIVIVKDHLDKVSASRFLRKEEVQGGNGFFIQQA